MITLSAFGREVAQNVSMFDGFKHWKLQDYVKFLEDLPYIFWCQHQLELSLVAKRQFIFPDELLSGV